MFFAMYQNYLPRTTTSNTLETPQHGAKQVSETSMHQGKHPYNHFIQSFPATFINACVRFCPICSTPNSSAQHYKDATIQLKSSQKHTCPNPSSQQASGRRCRSRKCQWAGPVLKVSFPVMTTVSIMRLLTRVVQALGMSTMPAMWPCTGAQERSR